MGDLVLGGLQRGVFGGISGKNKIDAVGLKAFHLLNYAETFIGRWKIQIGKERIEHFRLYLSDRIRRIGNRSYIKTMFRKYARQSQTNTDFVIHEQYAFAQQFISHG